MTARLSVKRWVGGVALVSVLLGCGAKMEAGLDGSARLDGAGGSGAAGTAQVVASTGGAFATGLSVSTGGTFATVPAIWAEFQVGIQAATSGLPGYVNLLGTVYDAPPLPDPYATVLEVGECRLVVATLPTCDAEPCNYPTEVCVSNDRCMTLPVAVDAGNAFVVGVTNNDGSDVTSLSHATGRYMAVGLAYPACRAGEPIRLDGGLDTASPFTVQASCIEPLELRGPPFWSMEASKPAEFTWVPATNPENSRISVIIDVEHYSVLPPRIRCNTADTGTLLVDAALITALIDLGTTRLPRAYLSRISSQSVAAGSGVATLEVASSVRKYLDIPGVPVCDDDGMCPAGTLCVSGFCVGGT